MNIAKVSFHWVCMIYEYPVLSSFVIVRAFKKKHLSKKKQFLRVPSSILIRLHSPNGLRSEVLMLLKFHHRQLDAFNTSVKKLDAPKNDFRS